MAGVLSKGVLQDTPSHTGELRRDPRLIPMPMSSGPCKAAPTQHTGFPGQSLLPMHYESGQLGLHLALGTAELEL